VVVLGDSFAMGWGVQQSESFPKVLESLSGKKILNAGISSYGTAREARLLDRIDTSALKTLIIEYCNNDVPENQEFYQRGNRLLVHSKDDYLTLVKQHKGSLDYYPGEYTFHTLISGLKFISRTWFRREIFGDPTFPIYRGGRPPLDEASLFLNALAHGTKKDLRHVNILVLETTERGLPDDEFKKQMLTRDKQNHFPPGLGGINFVDISNLLTEDDYYELDDHLNARGHALIAGRLLSSLAPRQLSTTR
jgi:lysophospholipase L1-like esterase